MNFEIVVANLFFTLSYMELQDMIYQIYKLFYYYNNPYMELKWRSHTTITRQKQISP
jgi:hypothetical protein